MRKCLDSEMKSRPRGKERCLDKSDFPLFEAVAADVRRLKLNREQRERKSVNGKHRSFVPASLFAYLACFAVEPRTCPVRWRRLSHRGCREWIVIHQLLVRRVIAADWALRIAAQTEFAELYAVGNHSRRTSSRTTSKFGDSKPIPGAGTRLLRRFGRTCL